MSNYLIFDFFTDHSTKILESHANVKILKMSGQIAKKIYFVNGPWIRDHIVKIHFKLYETCNFGGSKKNIIAEYLRRQGIEIDHLDFIPIQGGHLVEMNGENYCASSCGINFNRTQRNFANRIRHTWELETMSGFQTGESSDLIKRFNHAFKVVPSLVDFPWSFHLDLLVAPISKNEILLSNPLLGFNQFTKDVKEKLQFCLNYYQSLFESFGFNVHYFPVFYKMSDIKTVYHSPLNGLMIDKCFYFTLIEGMDEFNKFILNYLKSLTLSVELKPIYLLSSAIGLGGGLRCLSLEID